MIGSHKNNKNNLDENMNSDNHLNETHNRDFDHKTHDKTNLTLEKPKLIKPVERGNNEVLLSWNKLVKHREDENQQSLTCPVHQPLRKDIERVDNYNDPLFVHDYVSDIIAYHRRVERVFAPSATYMTRQRDINGKMRSILVDWLVEVQLKFKLMPESLYLTVSCIDRFLTKNQVSRKDLQLVGLAAMFIASKYEEIWAPEIRDLIYISDKAFHRDEIISMEKMMLNTLGFHLTVPTGYLFLQRFLKVTNADKNVSMLSHYLLELTLVEYKMLRFPYSKIAAAAVYTANKNLNKSEYWSYVLEQHSHYNVEEIQSCVVALTDLQKKAPKGRLNAVYKKFSGLNFNEVAKIMYT